VVPVPRVRHWHGVLDNVVSVNPHLRRNELRVIGGQKYILGEPLISPRPTTPQPTLGLLRASSLYKEAESMPLPDAERIVNEHDADAQEAAARLASYSCDSPKTTFHFFFGPHGGGKLWHAGLLWAAIKALDPNRACRVVWGGTKAPQNSNQSFADDFVNLGAMVGDRRTQESFNNALINACRDGVDAGAIVIVIMKLETEARRATVLQRLHAEHVDARYVAWICTTPTGDVPEFGLAGQAAQGAAEEMNYKQLRSQAESFVAVTAAERERLVFDRYVDFSAPPIDAWRRLRLARGASASPHEDGVVLLRELIFARGRIVEAYAFELLRDSGADLQCTIGNRVTDNELHLTGEPDILVAVTVNGKSLRRVVEVKSTTRSIGSDGWLESLSAWIFQLQCYMLLTDAVDGLLVVKQFLPTSPYPAPGWTVLHVKRFGGMRRLLHSTSHLGVAARVEELRRLWQPDWASLVGEPLETDQVAAVFRAGASRDDSRELLLRCSIAEECKAAVKRARLRLPVNASGVVGLLASFFYHERGVLRHLSTGSFLSRDPSAARSIVAQGLALGDATQGEEVCFAAAGRATATPLFRCQPLPLAAAAAASGYNMHRFDAHSQGEAAKRIAAAVRRDVLATDEHTLRNSTFVGQATVVHTADVAAELAARATAQPKGKWPAGAGAAPAPKAQRASSRKRKKSAKAEALDEESSEEDDDN
jgi:hypothetical protein